MSTNKITSVYAINNKQSNDSLEHTEWNAISSAVHTSQTKINSIIDDLESLPQQSGGGIVSLQTDAIDADKQYIKIGQVTVGELTDKGTKGINVSVSGNNNVNIEPRPSLGTGEGKNDPSNADRKGGNISLKPGDDIELCSHKRGTSKNTEVAVKVIDGNDNPVKLQIMAGDITLSTKGKNKTKTKDSNGADTATALYDDPNVMNINVTTGDGKGYLKVRAQAIDLRCEEHGGIALQPKGDDGQGHQNKIKFEHGGGDGLEFGTFNSEKTSIYTNEYRFKKDGVWKMTSRETITSDKYDNSDNTTQYKYVKQSDDFYDIVSSGDPVATTEQIIRAGKALFGDFKIGFVDPLEHYKVESVTLSDVDDDSDYVLSTNVVSNDLPSVGDDLTYGQAKIYEITDLMSPSDSDAFVDSVVKGSSSRIVTLIYEGTPYSYVISHQHVDYTLSAGNYTCSLADMIKLVNYFKTGAGQANGPWSQL